MKFYFSILTLFIFLVISVSCRKESFINDKTAKLSFSTDTVLFDTVFTKIGTATLQLKVYNKHSKPIQTDIKLAKGSISNYRINVNGKAGVEFNEIIIPENDSIFIFIEAKINPTLQNSPLVIVDSILFFTNQNIQDVKLVAWGQDIHLINGEIINSQNWINDKPYLIYNSMLLDTLETLTINEGVQVYLHKNSSIYIKGSLKILGTKDKPVVIQGDRLESFYENIPGQWGHIRLLPGSFDNKIDYAIIKNGIIGLQVDSFVTNPSLILSNTIIQNMNAASLYTQGSIIRAYNCVFGNSGQYSVALTIGGKYEFYHCTFGNYWNFGYRNTPCLIVNNYYKDFSNVIQVRQIDAIFGNCIIYGSLNNEIILDKFPNTDDYFTYKFDYCLIKIDPAIINTSDTSKFNNIIQNKSPKFVSIVDKLNYKLDTMSAAKDKAKIEYAILFPFDLEQENRTSDNGPDIGAYERIE